MIRRWLRRKLVNFLVKHLFYGLEEHDILTWKGGKLYVDGKQCSEGRQRELLNQAETIEQMELWQILRRRARQASHVRMSIKSKTWEDMIFGKAMLWTVELFDNIIHNLKKSKKRQ